MKKKSYLWLLVIPVLDLSLIYLMLSGEIRNFLHPKMNKFMYFTIFFLTNIALIEIYFLLRKKQSLIKESGIWVFVLPLAFLLIVQPRKLDPNTVKNKVSIVELNNDMEIQPEIEDKRSKNDLKDSKIPLSLSRERTVKDVDNAIDRIKKSKDKEDAIKDNSNHVPTVIEINPKELQYARIEGEKFKETIAKAYKTTDPDEVIEIIGFAFYQEDFKENQFLVSRLLMTCCVADTSLVGLLSDSSNLDIEIIEGRWYKLRGTVTQTIMKDPISQEDSEQPLLNLIEAEEIETPISPYIYP